MLTPLCGEHPTQAEQHLRRLESHAVPGAHAVTPCTITHLCTSFAALCACLTRYRGDVCRIIQRPDGSALVSVAVAQEEDVCG